MGKLAMWGAVAGIGKGMQTNAENKAKADLMGLEEAKEKRMLALRAQYDADAQVRGFKQQDKVVDRQQEGAETLEIIRNENEGARQDKTIKATSGEKQLDRDFEGEQKGLDRRNALDVAGIRANATGKGKGGGRFQAKTINKEGSYGPKGELIPGAQIPGFFDKQTGATFLQSGDKLLLPDVDPGTVQDNPRAVQYLMQNPGTEAQFLAKYKYLPLGYVRKFAQGGASAESADEE